MLTVHKITHILEKTSEVTGYPPEQVASVMAHCFNYLKKFTWYPTKAAIRIPYICVIRPKRWLLDYFIRVAGIPKLREGKITKERFRHYWNLRTLLRKDNERRDYKTRLGWKFTPSWRQDSDPVEGD